MIRAADGLHTGIRIALAVLPSALLWPALLHVVESRMSLHMLVEFPALFLAGWSTRALCLRHARAQRLERALLQLDWRGWTGATLVSCVALTWMLPSALDATLLYADVAAAKYASWWFAGWMLAGSWRRIDAEVLLFFIGNLGWMSATAGLLYIEAPQRLCVNYLQDDQQHAGIGLVLFACALGVVATAHIRRSAPQRTSTESITRRPASANTADVSPNASALSATAVRSRARRSRPADIAA